MMQYSLLDAICEVVLSRRSQRNCIMTDSLHPHKNGNAKRLPGRDVSSGKLWIVLRRAYHSVVDFLESGITARGVALSDFVVLEVLLHKGDLTAANRVFLAISAAVKSPLCRRTSRTTKSLRATPLAVIPLSRKPTTE